MIAEPRWKCLPVEVPELEEEFLCSSGHSGSFLRVHPGASVRNFSRMPPGIEPRFPLLLR